MTLHITYEDGREDTALKAASMEEMLEQLLTWEPGRPAARMIVQDDGATILVVTPDVDFVPPECHPLIATTMARLTAHSLALRASGEQVPVTWEKLLPGDPLITLAAELLGGDRLVLLRRCVPGSKALPGDWAPAALLRAVVGELTPLVFAKLITPDFTGDVESSIESVMNRLPEVADSLRELDAISWGLAERARLLLVARGWLPPLDAV